LQRNLHGPGIWLAGLLGVVKVGVWHDHRVWGVCNSEGVPVAIRRVDGEPFPSFKHVSERKTHCLVKGEEWHKPIGFVPGLPNIHSIALGEGLGDYLALCEQVLWESDIRVGKGGPYDLGPIDDLKPKLLCLPMVMLAAPARIQGEAVEWFRGRNVRIFAHYEQAGHAAGRRWRDQIAGVAGEVGFFNCGAVVSKPGGDFNDCYQIITERVLPI